MDEFAKFKKKSTDSLNDAEEILTKTYILTKDQKLFLSVLIKLNSALDSALNYLLKEQILTKTSFSTKVSYLREQYSTKLKLNEDDFEFFTLIKNLVDKHKSSSVEFARKEKFIMTDDFDNLHTLKYENLNDYLIQTKKIVAAMFMIS